MYLTDSSKNVYRQVSVLDFYSWNTLNEITDFSEFEADGFRDCLWPNLKAVVEFMDLPSGFNSRSLFQPQPHDVDVEGDGALLHL